jgi:hypothetical protein
LPSRCSRPRIAKRDLRWKRKAYASLPSLEHYVVIAQDAVKVLANDRASGFTERTLSALDGSLDLSAIGVTLPLRDIYRDTGIG